MSKNQLFYLSHIQDCILKIEKYTKDEELQTFLDKTLIQDAVIRNFEIIGEATKNLDPAFREKYPNIPWKKIAGMRDKLIHDYIGVDLWAVWAVVEDILPEFKTQITDILNKEKGQN